MKNFAFIFFLAAIIFAGGFFILNQTKQTSTPPPQSTIQDTEGSSSAQTIPGYQGRILAGESAPFLEFNKADYEKALSERKIILLNFYANWCPICRGEEEAIHAGFDGLTQDKVIGFRVNFNDSDTDSDEEALAKQFNIPYQHTKVILKNGKEISRSLDSWTKETFNQEITKALAN